jgi:flavin reductase (DIM6/NTAB) family NADH-FMN oxidoreductase RutF
MRGNAQYVPMSIEEAEFRRVLGHLATGVTVVASSTPDGSPRGLTASAVASVSLDPPLVLVCVERDADTHDVIVDSGAFAVSVLAEEAEVVARRFATYDTEVKFDGVAYREEVTGAPVLGGSLAWTDCRVWAIYDGGDHTIFVGEVMAADALDGPPLVYFRGGYGRLAP